MKIRSIFYNNEPRLRAGWRLLVQTILLGIFTTCAFLPMVFLPRIAGSLELFSLQMVTLIGTTLSIYVARRFVDKRTFVSLGLEFNRQALLDLVVGVVITFFMMALIFAIAWLAGWVTFVSFAWEVESVSSVILELLITVLIFILVGWNEELLIRGYHLQTLESGLNILWGVLLSSVVFSILHLANPNTESAGAVATGLFAAGIFLAFGYLRTRQLWLPIGLHLGWNFFESVIFGFPVSGLDYFHLIGIHVNGPELWTGGPFGPEAGLILIPGLMLGFALVYAYTHGRRDETEAKG